MQFAPNMTLYRRILGGFLFCALLTGIAAGLGVWSMRRVVGSMEAGAGDIVREIDLQNRQMDRLIPLRTLMTAIHHAKNDEELGKAGKRIQLIENEGAGDLDPILATIKRFLSQKSVYLNGLKEVADLLKQTRDSLATVTSMAMEIADDVEFVATIRIDDAIRNNEENFALMIGASESSVSSVKGAFYIRVLLKDLNAGIKDILLSRDVSFIDYKSIEIMTRFGNLSAELSNLTPSKRTETIASILEDLDDMVAAIAKARKRVLSGKAGKTARNELSKLHKVICKRLAHADGVAMNIVDDSEFDAALNMDQASVEVRKGFEEISANTSQSLSTVKAALSLRSDCNRLDAMMKDALLAPDPDILHYAKTEMDALFERVGNNLSELGEGETTLNIRDALYKLAKLSADTVSSKQKLFDIEKAFHKTANDINSHMSQLDLRIIKVGSEMRAIATETVASSGQAAKKWFYIQFGIGLAAVLVAILAALVAARFIVTPLKRVILGLHESAAEVSRASGQIADSGELLADNANEQASSLEEMSASLEQMAAVAKETTDLTIGSRELMSTNIKKSAQSLKSMVNVTKVMAEIESDNDNIAKIIDTIENIAFQTNLLALNAAVEAARAGDMGSGFAVVAGEVRKLALSTADAAQNTQELLNKMVERVTEAAQSVKSMNNDFEVIVESATVIGEKSNSITKATKEQGSGIEMVGQSTAQMDRISQDLAAEAEESSALSQSLSARADEMKEFVRMLVILVEGGHGKN